MIPQPYPLFYGTWFNGQMEIGRIVGWHHPAGSGKLDELQPIVLFDNRDGTVQRLGYVELDISDDSWVRGSIEEILGATGATAQFRKDQEGKS